MLVIISSLGGISGVQAGGGRGGLLVAGAVSREWGLDPDRSGQLCGESGLLPVLGTRAACS